MDTITQTNSELRNYLKNAILSIITNWQVGALLDHSTPAFLQRLVSRPRALQRRFAAYKKRLGHLISENLDHNQIWKLQSSCSNKRYVIGFTSCATFENGEAEVCAIFLKKGTDWKIKNFTIISK